MLIEEYGKIILVYSLYGSKVWMPYESISTEILRDVCITFNVEFKEMGKSVCRYNVYWTGLAYSATEYPSNSKFSVLNKTQLYNVILTKANSLWYKNDN